MGWQDAVLVGRWALSVGRWALGVVVIPRPCSSGPHLNPLPEGEADTTVPGEGTRAKTLRGAAMQVHEDVEEMRNTKHWPAPGQPVAS